MTEESKKPLLIKIAIRTCNYLSLLPILTYPVIALMLLFAISAEDPVSTTIIIVIIALLIIYPFYAFTLYVLSRKFNSLSVAFIGVVPAILFTLTMPSFIGGTHFIFLKVIWSSLSFLIENIYKLVF